MLMPEEQNSTHNQHPGAPMKPVLQPWVCALPFMQQSVLLAAIRGADGLHKEHPSKEIIKWYRRCVLYRAFEGDISTDPYQPGGGSFTGPVSKPLDEVVLDYHKALDEMPNHFHLHVMHASEILGYKHPRKETREWWHDFYLELVRGMHLFPESEEEMDTRLGDTLGEWIKRDVVHGKGQ